MSREIKFRAWDGSRMNRLGMSLDGVDGSLTAIDSNTTLMQYTGLKDKNGVEIYEGDIVEITHPSSYHHSEKSHFYITTDTSAWGFETNWEYIDGYETSTHIMDSIWDDEKGWIGFRNIEVIGNIYENPDLLKETK